MERRKLALMFTDIVGYSRLMGQNESLTIELLGEYRRILLAKIEEYKGSVVEFIGDAVFARFDTAKQAVDAGVEIQKALVQFNQDSAPHLPRLQSRIGIHFGEVNLKDGALFGDDVNIAARLEPLAVADGICVSGSVYKEIKDELAEPVKKLGVQPLKNINSKIKVYLIRPSGIGLGTHTHYFLRRAQQKMGAYRYPIAACIFALIAAGFYFVPRWLVPGYTANYVEIADFKNLMSEDGGPDYFSAGITEALRSQLADIRDVYILEADKGVRGPIRLEGSLQKIGENIRIAYRLFRRKDNVQIAGGKLDGAYQDIFILQDRIVAEIAGYLAKEFQLENFRPAALKITSDVTAYDYYMQGLEYLRKPRSQENYDAAIKLMSTALVHDKSFAGANAGICRAYWGKYEFTKTARFIEKAEEYCLRGMEQGPNLSDVYIALGMVYRDTGRYDQAISVLKTVIHFDANAHEAKLALANVYKLSDNDVKAEILFKSMIEETPGYWGAYDNYATFLIERGRSEEAINIIKQLLKITPINVLAYNNLGVAYFYLGEYEKSAKAFYQSVSLSPSGPGYSNTGTLFYFAGDYEKSSEMFREAIRIEPEDYRLYVNLADALRQLKGTVKEVSGFYEKAIEIALSDLEINKNNASTHQYLAVAYLHTGREELAEKHLNKSLELKPNDIDILYVKLRYLIATGDMDNSISTLKKLISAGYSKELLDVDPDMIELHEKDAYKNLVVSHDMN